MVEVVSLEFIGRRLDSMSADIADVRRRFSGFGDRFTVMEARLASIEGRLGLNEEGIDAVVERLGKLETVASRGLLLAERIAEKLGVERDAPERTRQPHAVPYTFPAPRCRG
jgi:hypothetical protein